MIMNRCRVVLIALVSLLAFFSCKPRIPSGILSQSKMEEVLYDYHLAQSAAEAGDGDVASNRYLYVQSVFQKHGITEAEFDSSMVWYSGNAVILKKIYDRLSSRFESESKSLGVGVSDTELYANMTEIGDTANIWSGARFLILEDNRLHNITSLIMQGDSTFLPGDIFKLSFESHFMGINARDAYTFLQIQYTDGSTHGVSQRLSSSYSVMMTLNDGAKNADARAERITITFFMPHAQKPSTPNFFYVTSPALLRIHTKKAVETETSADTDSLQMDSLAVDTVNAEADTLTHSRLSPTQLRDSKQVDRKIEIVKEKPLAPRRNTKRVIRRKS